MIYEFLAEGFEEVEALAPLDILRRAGKEVCTVGVTGKTVLGTHNIPIGCDITIDELDSEKLPEAVILPGGMPGTTNLEACEAVKSMVQKTFDAGNLVCAICAAPSVLGHMNLLNGKCATCFPGFETDLYGADVCAESVCRDGNIITAKGAGVALEFGFKITEALCGAEVASKLSESMQCR